MPVYEEKLISPFAIRFSQEHIKTTFRDGHVVEASIAEIGTRPGVEDYDLILDAPFPHIEIARWVPKGPERDGEHWFTLDNRRLYALQRAAAAHWPKTVAAIVQILYDDAGSVWKKYDSTTYGRTVSIAHRLRSAELSRWNWYQELVSGEFGIHSARTAKIVLGDDDKKLVDQLLDTPAEPGCLMARASGLVADTRKPKANASPDHSSKPLTSSEASKLLSTLACTYASQPCKRTAVTSTDTRARSVTSSNSTEDNVASSGTTDASRSDSDEPDITTSTGVSGFATYECGGSIAHVAYSAYDGMAGYGHFGHEFGFSSELSSHHAMLAYHVHAQVQAYQASLIEAQRWRMQALGLNNYRTQTHKRAYASGRALQAPRTPPSQLKKTQTI